MRICVATMGPRQQAMEAWGSVNEVVDGQVHVDPGTIERFDTARNDLLQFAAAEGYDWAIMLDTDEQLQFADTLRIPGEVWANADTTRFSLQDVLEHARSDVLMVEQIDGTYSKERIFRLPARGHYHGATHEAFILDDGARRNLLEGVTFSEQPKTAEQYRAKAERDLRILTRMTEEEPKDPRWWYYLGDTRAGLGDREGAIDAFRVCYSLNGWDEEAAWAAFRVAQHYTELERWDDAITWCVEGMLRRADFPELPWLAGWCCYQQGRYEQAIAWSWLAIAHGAGNDKPERVIFTYPPAHYEAPFDVIRWSQRQMGRDAGLAEYEFEEALAKRQKSER